MGSYTQKAVADLNPAVAFPCPLPILATFCNARARTNQRNLYYKQERIRGRHVGINGWLLVWVIVNALFVVWRVLVVSSEKKPPGRSIRSEGAGHATGSTGQRHRIVQ